MSDNASLVGGGVTLFELVAALPHGGDAVLHGNPELVIARIAPLELAGPGDIAFLSHAKYAQRLDTTQASCVILAPEQLARAQSARQGDLSAAFVCTPAPYLYFARLTQWWKARQDESAPSGRIHPSAVIDPSASLHPTARIGALCVIGASASVGEGTTLHARVTLASGCRIGARCIVHSGAVIGADGFGFAPRADKSWEKIEQLGAVVIGDDVEIGANTCIDRGALQDTLIEDGVKLDNLVQIGHNVRIGAHSALAGCAGVAGSAVIGKRCTIGGGAVVLGHLTLVDDVHISASTTVMRSLLKAGNYSGIFPVDDNASWERNAAHVRRLDASRDQSRAQMQALQRRVDQLEASVQVLTNAQRSQT